jgi:hypothetical protein
MNLIDKNKHIVYLFNAVLSVENKIRDNYEIPDIEKIVQKAIHFTLEDDQRPLKTSSAVRIGFGRRVLNFSLLVMCYGT